jgi:hypothetical protein
MYSLSDALTVPTVGRVSRLCEALIGTQRLRKVGVEPTTLGQTGQEVMQLRCQAVLFTAAPCPLQRPSVAMTYGHEEFHSMQISQGHHEQRRVQSLTAGSCKNRLGNLHMSY